MNTFCFICGIFVSIIGYWCWQTITEYIEKKRKEKALQETIRYWEKRSIELAGELHDIDELMKERFNKPEDQWILMIYQILRLQYHAKFRYRINPNFNRHE